MCYTLKSIESPDFFTCGDDYWLSLLDVAQKMGWQPEGTRYDLAYQIDDLYEDMNGTMYNMYMVVLETQWFNSWDKNYVDRENQVVSDDDAHYMKLALDNTGADPEFLDFLAKGGFRICSI